MESPEDLKNVAPVSLVAAFGVDTRAHIQSYVPVISRASMNGRPLLTI